MDIMDILKMTQSEGVTEQISKMTGIPESTTEKVLEDILPVLLNGMKGQASDKSTKEGFLKALDDHGKEDTADIRKFLSNVDVEDGSKIVKHLLGAEEEEAAVKATKKSGLDSKTILKIMAILAPLLMSKMGSTAKKTAKNSGDDMSSIVGGLLDGVDASDLIKIVGKFI